LIEYYYWWVEVETLCTAVAVALLYQFPIIEEWIWSVGGMIFHTG
jgi:hypothetical protein